MHIQVYIYTIAYMKEISTPNFDSISPQACINAKIRRLHRMLNNIYQARINPFGLKGSMLSILFMIGKHSTINQKTIAEKLVLDQSTVSRDLKKLEANRWINIYKGDDPRHSDLKISKEGYELLEKVSPVWEETHEKVHRLLGDYNIQQIDLISTAIQDNMDYLHS